MDSGGERLDGTAVETGVDRRDGRRRARRGEGGDGVQREMPEASGDDPGDHRVAGAHRARDGNLQWRSVHQEVPSAEQRALGAHRDHSKFETEVGELAGGVQDVVGAVESSSHGMRWRNRCQSSAAGP